LKVKFFAIFRELTGTKETGDFAAETLEELLQALGQHYGKKFTDWVWADGGLSDDVIILINGRAIEHLDGVKTRLQPADEIAIFPKMAGG
jgi:molybdopterin synthase sulfur carrier subunit